MSVCIQEVLTNMLTLKILSLFFSRYFICNRMRNLKALSTQLHKKLFHCSACNLMRKYPGRHAKEKYGTHELRNKKTCLRDFQPDPTQTRLYSNRIWLEV